MDENALSTHAAAHAHAPSEAVTQSDHHLSVEEELEHDHLRSVVRSFLLYARFMNLEMGRRAQSREAVPAHLRGLLPPNPLSNANEGVQHNQSFFNAIILAYPFVCEVPLTEAAAFMGDPVTADQMHRLKAVLHSCMREWSEDGKLERDESFGVVISELERLLPVTAENRWKQRVLVPGCGVGRLPLEIASRGYGCEGNEFSYYMLLPSYFLLNVADQSNCIPICPFVDEVSNVKAWTDITTPVWIPDRCSYEILSKYASSAESEEPVFSMAAGDFLEVYRSQENAWDAIVTSFFLDTAPCVLEYIATAYKLLRPGGYWINIGPLLYHWVRDEAATGDERYARSLELSWDDLRHAITATGFQIVKEEWRNCTYTRNLRSMMHTRFECILFVAHKPSGEILQPLTFT